MIEGEAFQTATCARKENAHPPRSGRSWDSETGPDPKLMERGSFLSFFLFLFLLLMIMVQHGCVGVFVPLSAMQKANLDTSSSY